MSIPRYTPGTRVRVMDEEQLLAAGWRDVDGNGHHWDRLGSPEYLDALLVGREVVLRKWEENGDYWTVEDYTDHTCLPEEAIDGEVGAYAGDIVFSEWDAFRQRAEEIRRGYVKGLVIHGEHYHKELPGTWRELTLDENGRLREQEDLTELLPHPLYPERDKD